MTKRHYLTVLLGFLSFYALGLASGYNHRFPTAQIVQVFRKVSPFKPEDDPGWVLQSAVYRKAPLQNDITMLGDSLTAFGPWSVLMPDVRVDNRGIPGESSSGLLKRLKRGDPVGKTVTVWTGANDEEAGLSLATSKSNLSQLVNLLEGRKILVVGTMFTNREKHNTFIAALDSYAQTLCRDNRCRYVDVNSVVAPHQTLKPEFTVEGVHLNWPGYLAVSRVFRAALGSAG